MVWGGLGNEQEYVWERRQQFIDVGSNHVLCILPEAIYGKDELQDYGIIPDLWIGLQGVKIYPLC